MNNILNFLKNILSPYESYLIVWVIFLLFSISFTLSGCQSETVKGPESTLPASSPGSADDLLIVDCLLPGKIKKLGRSIVYLEPRRPVRTTGLDCEIRGGEYVAYDRSNYSTALKVWLPKAKEGDMKAQTYVGEIYERGLGIEPDYSLAAKWYQRASEQGYSSAQINLGHLYEKGLGVPQDKVKALYWYRKASDLGEIIDLVPGGEEADRIDQTKLENLKQEIRTLRRKLERTQQELEQTRQKLNQRPEESETEQLTLQQLQQKLAKAQQELETRKREEEADSESVKALKDDYEQLQQKLAKAQQELETRKREEEADSESAKALKDDYEQQQQKVQHLNQKIARLEKEAQTYNQQLTALQQKLRNHSKELGIEKKTQKKIRIASRIFGNYHALIIGNNDYLYWDDLNTPKNDATRLANILETKYGFQTKVLINANRYTILDTLNTFREELTEEDNLLVYYAGHGYLEQKTRRGYWIPVDGEKDRDTNWIGTYQITDILQIMSSRHVLVIADSCYSGILTRSALTILKPGMGIEAKKEWIKVMIKKKSRTVLTSGDVAPVLDSGGGGKHSVFAKALIDFLLKNEEIVEGKRVQEEISPWITAVSLSLMAEQTPLYGPLAQAGHEAGDFFFVPHNGTLSANNMAFTLFSFVFLPEVNKFHIKK